MDADINGGGKFKNDGVRGFLKKVCQFQVCSGFNSGCGSDEA